MTLGNALTWWVFTWAVMFLGLPAAYRLGRIREENAWRAGKRSGLVEVEAEEECDER